nr:type II secretion system protein [Desulfobulbaceae bacterium]
MKIQCGLTDQHGFSLIEVIVGLVVFGILTSVFFVYLGSPMQNSSVAVVRLKNTMLLQSVMENIQADFKANKDLALLKSAVAAGGYGTYNVIYNDYVTFNGNDDEAATAAPYDLLKVTIQSTTDEFTLTSLFAVW